MTPQTSLQTLTLLADVAAWEQYRDKLATAFRLTGQTAAWGTGPHHYPCLVASRYDAAQQRVATCYVYPEDAARLLAAAAPYALVDGRQDPPQVEFLDQPPAAAPAAAALPPDYATVVASLRSNAAHLLAIVHNLIGVRITTRKRYEQDYARFLAQADQVVASRSDVNAILARAEEDATDGGTEAP